MRGVHSQQGDIILSWLLRLVVTLAVLALVIFEVVAITYAHIDADDAAGEVARAGTVAYRASGSLTAAREAAEDVADMRGVGLTAFERDQGMLVVEVERQARTLVVHWIPPLRPMLTRTGERRVELGT